MSHLKNDYLATGGSNQKKEPRTAAVKHYIKPPGRGPVPFRCLHSELRDATLTLPSWWGRRAKGERLRSGRGLGPESNTFHLHLVMIAGTQNLPAAEHATRVGRAVPEPSGARSQRRGVQEGTPAGPPGGQDPPPPCVPFLPAAQGGGRGRQLKGLGPIKEEKKM